MLNDRNERNIDHFRSEFTDYKVWIQTRRTNEEIMD